MRLNTYRRNPRPALVSIDWGENDLPSTLAPGEWVKTPQAGGMGMIVAMTDEEVSVLWSKLPRAPYNSGSYIESGYVYAPHIPMQVTPTVFKPEDFAPRKGIMTRYAKSQVNLKYYGTITIKDIK